MANSLYIHAINISNGGGGKLLTSLLANLPKDVEIFAQLDSRMMLENIQPNLSVRSVVPSIWQRLLAEFWLFTEVDSNDIVLCLGSLPPLMKLRGHA